jgi:hypothetical protein
MGQISVKTYAANGSLLNDNQHARSWFNYSRKLFTKSRHRDEINKAALLVLWVISSMIISGGFMRIFPIVVCNVHLPNVYATAQRLQQSRKKGSVTTCPIPRKQFIPVYTFSTI